VYASAAERVVSASIPAADVAKRVSHRASLIVSLIADR
jgi:hypothetical protein